MPIQVKICGINSVESADAAVRAGADYVGLVFHAGSRRNLAPEFARALAEHLRGRVRLVALVADAGDERIGSILESVRPDVLQLHGSETPERAEAIKRRFGIKVMKAIKVASERDLQVAKEFLGSVDWLMFDAKPPKDMANALPGGNALAFDWELLRQRTWPLPWMLSGGLTPENLAEAVNISRAEAVDVSSGVERKPGEKDPAKIRAFLARAKAL